MLRDDFSGLRSVDPDREVSAARKKGEWRQRNLGLSLDDVAGRKVEKLLLAPPGAGPGRPRLNL